MGPLITILQRLEQLDRWLFHLINGRLTNPVFDHIFLLFRQSLFWMPLYLFVFIFIVINFRKNAIWWIVFFVCTVAMTDMVGTRVFKHVVERLRPCADPSFAASVRLLLKNCAPGYSFVSNHAANHFGLATFFFFTMRWQLRGWVWIGFIWALMVSYGQIYVGIHYPTDVAGGALLGILFGLFMALLFNRKFGFVNFDSQPTVAP
ncbi:MAG TPA: phosphatase PAP2 family protein [Chitinophagaceae bacterium]|jgi:undecaprenyl-diphosphatase